MKKTIRTLCLAAAALSLVALATSCKRPPWFDTFLTIEGRLKSKGAPPTTTVEIESDLVKFRAVIDKKVDAGVQSATYYKMLGSAYLTKRMYGKALEAFQAAVELTPDNASLFYFIGVSAGYMSKAEEASRAGAQPGAKQLLDLAEKAYKRALEIDGTNVRAIYGLAVLYAYELDRPAEALPLLLTYLGTNTRDEGARFALARVYAALGKTEDSAMIYDELSKSAATQDMREAAASNRDTLRSGAGGNGR
jgi:tetratricopeptide (TPR) repeat protein